MRAFVYFPFLACVVGVGGTRLTARRTDPRRSARVLTATCVVLAAATAGALSLLAFTVVARFPLVAEHGHWRASSVAPKVPVPAWLGVFAVACIAAIAVNVVRTLQHYSRSLGPALRLQRSSAGEIVTVDDPVPFAYACRAWPFAPGVIVVSAGLRRTLDGNERAAVLAHEQSHLVHHHGMYELAALVSCAFNPLLRPIGREISFSLERWADEDAANAQGRDVAACALVASAIERAHPAPLPALAHSSNDVPARVRALLDSQRPQSRILMITSTVNAAIATAAVLLAAHSTELIFEALRR